MKFSISNIDHNKKEKYLIIIFITVVLILNIIIKAPQGESENFYNSDASYHQLLTIKAMEETPMNIHKLLPIVSLGAENDKYINWGATIPDKYGNYYYTSFPPIGFVIPYLFFEIFNLDVNLNSLYIFNSILLGITTFLIVYLYNLIFKSKINKVTICILTSLTYLFSVEIMHSMGIVYWAQSLFQVFFLIQVIVFLKYIKLESGRNKRLLIIFLIMCIVLPSVEWTGYVSNFGFIIALISNRNFFKYKNKKLDESNFKLSILILISTIISGIIFIGHFLMVCNVSDFLNAMASRFFARSITTGVSTVLLLEGIMNSFGLYLILLCILTTLIVIKKITRECLVKNIKIYKIPIIILLFPMIENIIMKEHAISYSFDRMKLIFIIILWLLILVTVVNECFNKKIVYNSSIIVFISIITITNVYNYTDKPNIYRWSYDNLSLNQYMVKYINKYNNSLLGQKNAVRGYANLLFGRGIYEGTNMEFLISKSMELNSEYAILLNSHDTGWKKYWYSSAEIYDINNNSKFYVAINYSNDLFEGQENIIKALENSDKVTFEFKGLKEVLFFTNKSNLDEKKQQILEFVNNKLIGWDYVIWSFNTI